MIKMFKQIPEIQGKSLNTWEKLGPLSIDDIESNS